MCGSGGAHERKYYDQHRDEKLVQRSALAPRFLHHATWFSRLSLSIGLSSVIEVAVKALTCVSEMVETSPSRELTWKVSLHVADTLLP